MRETTALIRSFDTDDTELINEFETSAGDKFILPTRNWNRLIEDYNIANKKKFELDALDCRTILEYAKQGIPPKHVFEACGVTNPKYAKMYMQAQEAEDKLQELNAKEFLTDDEFDLFQVLLRLPVRVLMVDVSRAEGISKLMDWEQFNKNAKDHAEVQFAKMKARFKDYFADKNTEAPNYNVTIALGGDFISNL